jgi:hypothetical protein
MKMAQQDLAFVGIDGFAYDATAAGNCIATLQGRTKACVVVPAVPCPGLFVGTLQLGEACTDSSQCAQSGGRTVTCVSPPPMGAAGSASVSPATMTCGYAIHGQAGEACARTCDSDSTSDVGCSSFGGDVSLPACYETDGFRCDEATLVCVKVSRVGEACSPPEICVTGARCDGGVCVAVAPLDATAAQSACAGPSPFLAQTCGVPATNPPGDTPVDSPDESRGR